MTITVAVGANTVAGVPITGTMPCQ